MAPFMPVKRASNMRPRGPVPRPLYGQLKAVPGPHTNGNGGDGTPPLTAPVCPDNVYFQPVYSPVHLQQPPIPVAAQALPSVTNVLNQVVHVLNQYFTTPAFHPGNGSQIFILGNSQGAVRNAHAVNNGSTTVKGRWLEVDRQTEDVRVENPDDSDQYVIIKRINSLTMRNSGTGEVWKWERQNSAG